MNRTEIFRRHVGDILVCERRSTGRVFAAKLEEIRGDFLIFRSSSGQLTANNAADVVSFVVKNV